MAKHTALAVLIFASSVAQAGIYSYRAEDGSIVFTDEPSKGAKDVVVEEPMTVPAFKPKPEIKPETDFDSQPLWPEPKSTVLPRDSSADVPAYDNSSNTSWSSETQGVSSGSKVKQPKVSKRADPSMIQRASDQVKKKTKKSHGGYSAFKVLSPTAGSSRWVGGELTVELALKPMLEPDHVISLRVDGREVAVGPELQMVVPDISRGGHTLRAAVLDVSTGKQLMVSDEVQFQIHRASKNENKSMLHPSLRKKNN